MTDEHNKSILITVVICTHRRPDSLRSVLDSLARQTCDSQGWEVLVVENDSAPTGDILQLVEEYQALLDIRYCLEPIPNLSRTRNLGAKQARGVYVAYIDDDVEVVTGWISALFHCCGTYSPDFCGGPSYPLFRVKKPNWYREEWATHYVYGSQERSLQDGEWLGGMNYVVKRELVQSLGGFREELGMAGDRIGYGEETCLLRDAWSQLPDNKVRYAPDAVVMHEVRPVKMTLTWILKSLLSNARDRAVMDRESFNWRNEFRTLIAHGVRLLLTLPGFIVVLVVDLGRPGRTLWRRYVCDAMRSHIWCIARAACGMWNCIYER